jgi:hypothetical protein
MDTLPCARMTVNAGGDLVMRMRLGAGCAACGTNEVEIVVEPSRAR